jgi:SulP family sulfate permease
MMPGTVVGEVSAYLGRKRTASVVSDQPSTVYRLTKEALERMEREAPDLAAALHRSFARLLAERLTDLTATVGDLLD